MSMIMREVKISLTAPISSQCRSRRPGLQIVSDKRTKMQSLNLNLDKKKKKKQTLAVWTHFNASLHFRLILSSLYKIHDTNFTRYSRIRSSLYEAMNEAWPRTKRWTLNFSILVLTASAILLKQKGCILRCIYWIHVWESVSWSSRLVVKVGRQDCCHCIT